MTGLRASDGGGDGSAPDVGYTTATAVVMLALLVAAVVILVAALAVRRRRPRTAVALTCVGLWLGVLFLLSFVRFGAAGHPDLACAGAWQEVGIDYSAPGTDATYRPCRATAERGLLEWGAGAAVVLAGLGVVAASRSRAGVEASG